jgi:tetratricopeptide (TPR) repeat protein
MGQRLRSVLATVAALMTVSIPVAAVLRASPQSSDGVTVQGTVRNIGGKPVGEAVVRLEQKDVLVVVETKTSAIGAFTFSSLRPGRYLVSAEKSGSRSRATEVIASSREDQQKVDLVLEDLMENRSDSGAPSSSSIQAMTFADKPNFTVAGVTDWTAVGGHGSDSSLRTSETLANETLTLKAEGREHGTTGIAGNIKEADESESKLRTGLAGAPDSFEANHRLGEFYLHAGRYRESILLLQKAHGIDATNYGNEYDLALAYEGAGDFLLARERVNELLAHQENGDLHRLAGELNEKLGDPLTAVHEYEQAVRLDPSEQNYFAWGSELLLHRAVWQAQEVFHQGVEAYPKSARMLTGLGTALFASARYDEAALRLCSASDLNPDDPEPYIFMGKIQIAAPDPMACVEPKLARFVKEQPENSLANYFYAMAILKRQQQAADKQALQQVEALLTKAVTIDTKCGDAYLELGILSASQHDFEQAIDFYTKAIEADPQLGEAHYRLGVAYDRMGEPTKAKQEFHLHDEITRQQAEAIERQRREVKQFLIVLPEQPAHPPAH